MIYREDPFMAKKPEMAYVSADMDVFSAVYALFRWSDVKIFYRKDRSFYLVYTKDENGDENHLFWIDIVVFKKLWDLEMIDDENVDAGNSVTGPF